MRGIPSLITDIRKKVFTEVARMAYSGEGYGAAEELPYIIVPGDQPLHRESVFLQRHCGRTLQSFLRSKSKSRHPFWHRRRYQVCRQALCTDRSVRQSISCSA